MRKWAILALVVALMLAACNGDEDKDTDQGDNNAPSNSSNAVPMPGTGTEEAEAGVDTTVYEPGVDAQTGLTVLTHSVYSREGTAHVFAQVQNDSGQTLNRVESYVYALDAQGFPLGSSLNASPLITDIPPGQVFYVGLDFPAGEEFSDVRLWIQYETGQPSALTPAFNLPVTIDSQGAAENGVYTVRGAAQNTSPQNLMFPVVDVALIGPDNELVGFAHAVITGGLGEDGTWAAGAAITFEAAFNFIAVEPGLVQEAAVLAVGYAAAQ